MNCERAETLLGAYLDGEMTAVEREALTQHLEACPSCSAALADFARLGQALRAEGRAAMPVGLTDKVRRALDSAVEDEAPKQGNFAIIPSAARVRLRPLLGRAAALIVACSLSATAAWWATDRRVAADRVEREVVNAHVRSLLQDSPVQVASSEQHTVKPWFAGRADFAPVVKDLSAQGFPLVGGRLDFIDGRRVSALVYKRRLHTINVFIWPTEPAVASGTSASVRNGYNIVSLVRNGTAVWIVSDLNSNELWLLAGEL